MNVLLIGESGAGLGDNDQLLRNGIVICEASEREVKRRLNRYRPAWVVLVYGPAEDVLFRLFTICREADEQVRLAVLGPPDGSDRCRRWLQLGADVYLSSDTNLRRLLTALAAAEGCGVTVVERGFVASVGQGERSAPPGVLSEREQEVLALVAEGMNNQQIAERLFITNRTVAFHVSNLLAKLNARNRTHAVEVARLLGIQASVS
jgi:DNA-binding NarL/FixJ family response regulator